MVKRNAKASPLAWSSEEHRDSSSSEGKDKEDEVTGSKKAERGGICLEESEYGCDECRDKHQQAVCDMCIERRREGSLKYEDDHELESDDKKSFNDTVFQKKYADSESDSSLDTSAPAAESKVVGNLKKDEESEEEEYEQYKTFCPVTVTASDLKFIQEREGPKLREAMKSLVGARRTSQSEEDVQNRTYLQNISLKHLPSQKQGVRKKKEREFEIFFCD